MLGTIRGVLCRAIAVALFTSSIAQALPAWGKFVQWTSADVATGDLATTVRFVAENTSLALKPEHFALYEDRALATSRFVMYTQQAGTVPIRSAGIRLWLDRHGKTIRGEAFVTAPPSLAMLPVASLSSGSTLRAVDRYLAGRGENARRRVEWRDYYENGRVVRVVRIVGSRGRHELELAVPTGQKLSERFEEFPQADTAPPLAVNLYPVYEEVEQTGEQLRRVPTTLDNLLANVADTSADPLAPLREKHWTEAKYDPLLGATAEGQARGFWAMPFVRALAAPLISAVPQRANDFAKGLLLEGKYVTVSLHPLAPQAFQGLSFTPGFSTILKPDWKETAPNSYEMIPYTALRGRPILSATEAFERPARRLPNHDAKSYIEDGFDELQVYWSVDRFFASLRQMGFADPELSTRPFNAILYDPDISYRDNAFYTDDTINFTTYSGAHPNFARDNTTIWHELGHGVMDRLMGDVLKLDDTGGLSEGMADFLALLVIENQTGGVAFPGKENLRIFNRTGFFLTNEVHDDGEAYGGVLADFLGKAIARDGRAGLTKVTDLTLEAMRYARNHPGLTADDWFQRILFADERGSAFRRPREMGALLREALAGRNFVLGGGVLAKMDLRNGQTAVLSSGPGSRNTPIQVSLAADEVARATLNVKLESGAYRFKYPVTVEVGLRGGPLQGAIGWENEATAPFQRTISADGESVSFDLAVTGRCDAVNRPDGSCVDFAYVKVLEAGQRLPVAKKRFYYQVKPKV